MKIAIVSDLHIGYERFEEDAFRQASEALEEASKVADLILIPGDVFDKRAPKPEVIAQAIRIFRNLLHKEWAAQVIDFESKNGKRLHTTVPIIAIPGTHERTAEGKENVLSLLSLAGLLVDVSESRAVVALKDERVAVFGLGGVSEERVREALQRLDPKPIENAFNVFMMHQSTYELLPFSNDVIRNNELPEGFDLYVNGHIHSKVEMTVHGKKFLIPGSTVLTQLKEGEQEKKGFILFDTSTSNHQFIPINSRPFLFVRIPFNDATPKDLSERCEKEIERILKVHDDGKPIIKLVLEGSIANGFSGVDMPIRSVVSRYSGKAIVEIDSSKLKNPGVEKEIEELREGAISGVSIKELGFSTFLAKLKEQKFDDDIDAGKLFEILSKELSKEKVLKEANELLSNEN